MPNPLRRKLWKLDPYQILHPCSEGTDVLAALQQTMMGVPVLPLPSSQGNLTIYTDACDEQMGCGQMQYKLDPIKKALYIGLDS